MAVDMEWCFDHLRGHCREVYISHVLEHFLHPGREMLAEKGSVIYVLKGINKMLKPGGVVRVAVPDFRALSRVYIEKNYSLYPRLLERICGGQIYPEDLHRCVFDKDLLVACLHEAGFEEIKEWAPFDVLSGHDSSSDCIEGISVSLNLVATKKKT